MTKFNVGDKVRILDVDSIMFGDEYWNDGDIAEVIGTLFGGLVLSPTKGAFDKSMAITPDEFNAIEKVSGDNEELEQLKRRVSELEARLDEERSGVLIEINMKGTTYRDGSAQPSKTPNELRAEIIEKAKEFIKEVENNATRATVPEYTVNEEKRSVVSLVRGCYSNVVYERGVAKRGRTGVFNADIGKAIALGRAYGLDVSEFEQAPQPDEVTVGMKVEDEEYSCVYKISEIIEDVSEIRGYTEERHGLPFRVAGELGWLGSEQVRILSDTEAKY